VNEGEGAWTPLTKEMITKLKEKSKPRIEASTDFKKIKADLDKVKKRGKMVIVGDILKDKEKDPKKKKIGEDGEDDENASLSREERKKKYMERPDIIESLNIAADLALELHSPTIRVGSKLKTPGPTAEPTPEEATTGGSEN
jgi:hypothetical protein